LLVQKKEAKKKTAGNDIGVVFYALSFVCPKERAKEKGTGNYIQPIAGKP